MEDATTDAIPDPWPLRHLVLRSPRLELRPDDDAGLLELVERTYEGVHDPATMPFSAPWTDAPRAELGRNTVQFHWSQRSALKPAKWTVNFLIRLDGTVIGVQAVGATDFAVTRAVGSGSWLGRRYQGFGYGVEMRAAMLQFVFDHLGAVEARSGAFTDNAASLAVSRKLGYIHDGTHVQERRGRPGRQQRLVLTRERFAGYRPDWTVTVDGLTGDCRQLLGVRAKRRGAM